HCHRRPPGGRTMNGIIDADTHVVESQEIWSYFDKEVFHRRPVALTYDDPESGKARIRWMIDGVVIPKPEGKGGQALQTPPADAEDLASRGWRTKALLDIPSRLEDADAMGVDVQVIFPTLFIAHITFDPELDAALARAYNRFMANVWS